MILRLKDVNKDQVVIVSQKQVNSECRFVDNIPHKKGQIMYEFSTLTGKLTRAEFSDTVITFHKITVLRKIIHKLIMKKNCYYVAAMNERNAFRKLNNHFDL